MRACNAKGVLVDLAHSTSAAVEQALGVSHSPMVWSHGWVDGEGGVGRIRGLPQAQAVDSRWPSALQEQGGVIGSWGSGCRAPGRGWPVAAGDTKAYAREIAKLVDQLGPDHVGFGHATK